MTAHPRTPFADPSAGYSAALTRAYEQDRIAELRLTRLARRHDGPANRGLYLMAALYGHSADLLAPLAVRAGANPRGLAALHAQGLAEAATAPRWHEVLAALTTLHPACLPEHNLLISLAPSADRACLALRIDRDLALTDFGFASLAGQRDPDRHLLHMLERLLQALPR